MNIFFPVISRLLLITLCAQMIFANMAIAINALPHNLTQWPAAEIINTLSQSSLMLSAQQKKHSLEYQQHQTHASLSIKDDINHECQYNCHCSCTHFAILSDKLIYPLRLRQTTSMHKSQILNNNIDDNVYRPPIA